MSNDIPIQQAGNTPTNIQIRSGPTYLISLLSATNFIATKVDEGPSTVKVVGFFSKIKDIGTINTNYVKMVAEAKIEDFVEISFPWHQICSIQNLIYRHKGNK